MKFLHCDFGALFTAVWVASALAIMAPSKPIALQKAAIAQPISGLIRAQIVHAQVPTASGKQHLGK
ncbi:MAG TPA: hypothetical protein V6C57_04835 [Coleofasciculaceae cyanobacterium]